MAKRKRNKKGRFTKKTRTVGRVSSKPKKRRSGGGKKRRRSNKTPIRGIMKRRSNNGGGRLGWMDAAMGCLANGGGQLGALALDMQLQKIEKLPEALKSGKARGALIFGLGTAGARYANKSLRQVAMGVGGTGVVIAAKELLPAGIISGIGRDELSPAEADLIESLALNGLEGDATDTMTGDMDADVSDTVTGDDDDGDDDTMGDDDDGDDEVTD